MAQCMRLVQEGKHAHKQSLEDTSALCAFLSVLFMTNLQKLEKTCGPYRGVLAQLAERGEGFLMSLANLLDKLFQFWRHFIAVHHHLLFHVLLLLVAVVPHS